MVDDLNLFYYETLIFEFSVFFNLKHRQHYDDGKMLNAWKWNSEKFIEIDWTVIPVKVFRYFEVFASVFFLSFFHIWNANKKNPLDCL